MGEFRGVACVCLCSVYCVVCSMQCVVCAGALVFCRISSLLQGSFAKETYPFDETTNRSAFSQSTLHLSKFMLHIHHMIFFHISGRGGTHNRS